MSFQNDIKDEYQRHFLKYLSNVVRKLNAKGKPIDSYGKLSGAIAATIIKKYIEKVIIDKNLPYTVSENNVYVEGCVTEWDLLIVKKGATGLDGLPIYKLDDVAVVVECKAFGLFFKRKDATCNPLENFLYSYNRLKADNEKLRAIYITISEQFPVKNGICYADLTKKVMYNGTGDQCSVFCVTKNREVLFDNGYDWETFILNHLK